MQSTDGIRAAVESTGHELERLGNAAAAGVGKDLAALRTSWGKLVDALALGPAPEYRKCPHCGSTGMRAATRCGTCWKELVPPPAAADGHWSAPE